MLKKNDPNNMIDIKLNAMGNKKKKYVSPLMEELGFESEVQLLTASRSTLQKMELDNTFNSSNSTSARENDGHDYVFDEE